MVVHDYIKNTILHGNKDGNFYPEFLVHKNLDNVHKNVQKRYKIFKPKLLSALEQGQINHCKNLAFFVSYRL